MNRKGNRKNATIREADAMNEQDEMTEDQIRKREEEAMMLSKPSKKMRNSDENFNETNDQEERPELSATQKIAAGEVSKSSIEKKVKKQEDLDENAADEEDNELDVDPEEEDDNDREEDEEKEEESEEKDEEDEEEDEGDEDDDDEGDEY